MPYIAPNSRIHFLKGVPLEPTYDHTLYFTSKAAQLTYFASKVKGPAYQLDTQSYQRHQRGTIRVSINVPLTSGDASTADLLMDCNYCMYQNTAFGDKWFYAFILNVEYVNNSVAEVRIMLDDMQTWHFDYELGACFVEREHVDDDTIGKHLVEENLEVGEWITRQVHYCADLEDFDIIIAATAEPNEEFPAIIDDVTGGMYAGIYSGAKLKNFQTAAGANVFIEELTEGNKSDALITCFMYPRAFVNDEAQIKYIEVAKDYNWTYDGHAPRNNKLYTYPYTFLHVLNGEGDSADFRYEDFSATNRGATFMMRGTYSTAPQIALSPSYYKSIIGYNPNEMLVINSMPQCSMNVDSFKAWLAQNRFRLGAGLLGAAASMVSPIPALSLLAAAPGSQALIPADGAQNLNIGGGYGFRPSGGGVAAIGGMLATVADKMTMPNRLIGQNTQSLGIATNTFGFSFFKQRVKDEYARIIDDYFDRFGYACRRTKIPNRNVRAQWTFTKTQGCTITGSIPGDSARNICEIYNAGITFWRNPENVGNYTLANTPNNGAQTVPVGENSGLR